MTTPYKVANEKMCDYCADGVKNIFAIPTDKDIVDTNPVG